MELDKIAKSLDKYGFASVSTPFLSSSGSQFEFDLDKPASDYFDMALSNRQGGVRNLDSLAIDTQVAVRVNIEQALATLAKAQKAQSLAEFNIAKAQAGVQVGLLNALTTANPAVATNPLLTATVGMLEVLSAAEAPELPEFTPDTTGLPAVGPSFANTDRNALTAVGGTLSPGLSFPSGPFTLSAREALLIASGDHMTQSLLGWFTRPAGNKLGDYEMFFCPMIVSVQPGYKTSEYYRAEVTVNVDLARETGSELDFLSESFPYSDPPIQVSGVFPVLDSQVLDLVNSRRRLYSMAFQLAMTGFGAESQFFLDFAQKLEQDVQTPTAISVASAYTIGGTAFGFRVEPKFVASKDPTQLVTEPGQVLESKTFPALAVLLVHRSYLKRAESSCGCPCNEPKNCACPGTAEKPTPVKGDAGPSLIVKSHRSGTTLTGTEPFEYVVFQTGLRWSPTRLRQVWLSGHFTETEAWERAAALDKAERWITGRGKDDKWFSSWVDSKQFAPLLFTSNETGWDWHHLQKYYTPRQLEHLASRAVLLRKMALDSRSLVRVKSSAPAKEICVASVSPDSGWLDQHTLVTIRGSGFRGNVQGLAIGGLAVPFAVPNDCTLVALVPPWGQAKSGFEETAGSFAEEYRQMALAAGDQPSTLNLNTDIEKLFTDPVGVSPSTPEALAQRIAKICDPLLTGDNQTPPPPLTSAEKNRYESLGKRITECSAKCEKDTKPCDPDCELLADDKKIEEFNSLAAKDNAHQAWLACEKWSKEVLDKAKAKKSAFETAWADIAIHARVPVHACADKAFPGNKPGFPMAANGGLGWIKFTKHLPKKSSKPSKGEISISRDKSGRITGVKVGEGGFEHGAQLLQLIADQLGDADKSVSLDFNAEGKASVKTEAGSTTTGNASDNKD